MRKIFTIAVVGSRDFDDFPRLTRVLDGIKALEFRLVSGGARGADRLAEDYARMRGIDIIVLPAEWEKHGLSAGKRRNQLIVNVADAMIAFWDGRSKGTKDVMLRARIKGIPVHVVRF